MFVFYQMGFGISQYAPLKPGDVHESVFLQLLGSCEAASLPPHYRHPACVNLGHCHRLKKVRLSQQAGQAIQNLQESR